MQIQQVEDDSVTQVAKRAIIDGHSLSGIDHLYVVEIGLLHGLKVRYFCTHPFKVMLDGVVLAPTDLPPLRVSDYPPRAATHGMPKETQMVMYNGRFPSR